MNERIIDFKLCEYVGRFGVAFYRGKSDETLRRLLLTKLLYLRLKTRAVINRQMDILSELRAAERGIKKMSENSITFPLGEQRVKKLKQDLKEVRKELVETGRMTTEALDFWQSVGATLYDLCNLCNRDYAQALKELEPKEREGEKFSSLIFVYNLDYKDPSNRCWIDFDVDAPLTHAVLEHFRDLMISTPKGRELSRKAMEECFPGIMENALTMVTDEDGTRHLMDKDGVEVVTLDDEDELGGHHENT